MNKTVSIVVPTYNQGRFIRDTLESIRSQSYSDFEVIIQDSCSKDDTQEICEEFAKADARFRYFREKDNGQSDAINRGLDRSRGTYWTWICSDDYYANNTALDQLMQPLLVSSTDCIGTFGDAYLVNEDGSRSHFYPCEQKRVDIEAYKRDWPFSQPASVLKIEPVRAAGGVDVGMHLGMDLDLFIRLLISTSRYFDYVPHEIALVRMHGGSKSIALEKKTMVQAMKILVQYFGPFFGLPNTVYWRSYKRMLTRDYVPEIDFSHVKMPVSFRKYEQPVAEIIHEVKSLIPAVVRKSVKRKLKRYVSGR